MRTDPLTADQLLDAAGGDREEALRLLFVLSRQCADNPTRARATGPELAAILAELLQGDSRETWTHARRMATVVTGPAPTAANVVQAIDQVLNGAEIELPPPERRYDEKDLLGIGGMGRVHRVVDTRLRRSVARKSLHPGVTGLATANRFALEAQLTAQLDHPNIVPLYDFDRDADGGLYFTMKEVRGRTLADAIDDASHAIGAGADPNHELLKLVRAFRQVCDGVAFAHDQAIAHRDLKPDNVMLGDFGEVLVMDWGLAQQFGAAITGLAGTPQYMAPEVAREELEAVGASADVYSLGATLYHLLALEPPYASLGALDQVRAAEPPPPSERADHPIPDELEAVVLRAMARSPEDRYASVADLAEDVQAWLDGRPLASLSYGPTALAAKWVRRNRRLVYGVAATALVAGVLGAGGAVRYVLDVTAARDEARANELTAEHERDRARDAELVARERLVDAQLAAARASTETGRFTHADELYRAASDDLAQLSRPQIGPELGLLDNYARAERPLFEIPVLDEPGLTLIEREHGWIVQLKPGELAIAREPPLFEARWTSAVDVPECVARAARWEGDTLAFYCADETAVERIDLGSGGREEVAELVGLPVELQAPAHTDLLFVGHGDMDHWAREPMLSWRLFSPGEAGWAEHYRLDVNEIPSARGPWFVAERYARGHGTVLYHRDRGPVRTLGLPLAKGALSSDGRFVAAYHEGSHELFLQSLETGATRWRFAPDNPLVVWSFSDDDRTLYAAGSTPTILEISADDGEVLAAFDGHTEPVREVLAAGDLVLSRALDDRVLGTSRSRPSDRLEGSGLGLLPPGEIAVLGDPTTLYLVDVATRRELKRVELPVGPGEGWEAESLQADGALVVSEERIVFVPALDGPIEPIARSDGRPLRAGDRSADGHVAFCRGSEVILRTPDGTEHTLGSIERDVCRDLRIAAPDRVFVSDFWGFAVHRFGLGHSGPIWTKTLDFTVFRLSIEQDLVAVGDWTGRVTVYDQESGEVVQTRDVIEGPALGTALSPDAQQVAVGGWDHRLAILDLATGRTLAEDARHAAPVEWITWSADQRLIASAEPEAVLLRDLDLPARLEAARIALTDLAADPDRERTGAEWAEIARGLAAHGLFGHALSLRDRADGLQALELARWHWNIGELDRAAEAFARARTAGGGDRVHLTLCERAVRSKIASNP